MTASTFTGAWSRGLRRGAVPVIRIGHMLVFFVRAVAGVPVALRHYRGEFVRLLSDIAWGNGSLVVGGGTAGVAVVLGITVGALVGIEGYNFLDLLGLGPATGIISSLVNTRELAPIAASWPSRPKPAAASPRNWARCASPRRSTRWTPWRSGRSHIW